MVSKEDLIRVDTHTEEGDFAGAISLMESMLSQETDMDSASKFDLLFNLGYTYICKSDEREGVPSLLKKAKDKLEKALFLISNLKEKPTLENQIDQYRSFVYIEECNQGLGDNKNEKKLHEIINRLLGIEQQVLADDKMKQYLWQAITEAYHSVGSYSKAIEYLQKTISCLNDDKKKSKPLLELVGDYYKLQDFAKSEEICRSLIELAGENSLSGYYGCWWMGEICYNRKQLKKSRDWYLKAFQVGQVMVKSNKKVDMTLLKIRLGAIFCDLGKYRTSLKYLLDVAPSLSPETGQYPIAHNFLGFIYAIKQNWQKAVLHYQNVLGAPSAIEREKVVVLNALAKLYGQHLKDYQKAIEYYEKLLKLGLDGIDESEGDILALLGYAYRMSRQLVRSTWAFKKIIDDNLPYKVETREVVLQYLVANLLELQHLEEAKHYNDILAKEYGLSAKIKYKGWE